LIYNSYFLHILVKGGTKEMLITGLINLLTGANDALTSLGQSAVSLVFPSRRSDDEIRHSLMVLHGVPHDHPLRTNEGKID
jgi:hypothetical protein